MARTSIANRPPGLVVGQFESAANRRYFDSMLIRVQATRRDPHGNLIATILNERGGSEDRCLSLMDAEEVERIWAMNQFDLNRYEGLPVEFPTPDSIPVEVSEAVAQGGNTCWACRHAVGQHNATGCLFCDCRLPPAGAANRADQSISAAISSRDQMWSATPVAIAGVRG